MLLHVERVLFNMWRGPSEGSEIGSMTIWETLEGANLLMWPATSIPCTVVTYP